MSRRNQFQTLKFLQDHPKFIEESSHQSAELIYNPIQLDVHTINHRVKSAIGVQTVSDLQVTPIYERCLGKFHPIVIDSEYFQGPTLPTITPKPKKASRYQESPFVTQRQAEAMQIPKIDLKNNLIFQYHDAYHQSMQPKIECSLKEAEVQIMKNENEKVNFLQTLELFFNHSKVPLSKIQFHFLDGLIKEFEKTLDTDAFVRQCEKDGGHQFQTYQSVDRQRQMAMQLAIWMKDQLTELRKQGSTFMINELFQKLHVIIIAAQMELSRQVLLHMKEWSHLIDQISQILIRTFHQGVKIANTNQMVQEQENSKKVDTLHTIYQQKLDEMFERENQLKITLINIKESQIKQNQTNLYLRKKCLKLEYTNYLVLSQNDTLRDDLLYCQKQNEVHRINLFNINSKSQKSNKTLIQRTSLQYGLEDLFKSAQTIIEIPRIRQSFSSSQNIKNKPTTHYSLFREKKQISDNVLQKMAYLLSNKKNKDMSLIQMVNSQFVALSEEEEEQTEDVAPDIIYPQLGSNLTNETKEPDTPQFQVNEHIEQELFIQNNLDFNNNFIGEMQDQQVETSISLTYGIDKQQQVDYDLKSYNSRSVSMSTENETYEKSTQCNHMSDPQSYKQPTMQKHQPLVIEFHSRLHQQSSENIEDNKLLKQRRIKLLENAPKIRIFTVENLHEKNEASRTDAQDSLRLLQTVKDRVSQLCQDVQKFNSLKEEEKSTLKNQLNSVNTMIGQVGNKINTERLFQHKKSNSLILSIAEKDNEKLQLQSQLESMQQLAMKLQSAFMASEGDSRPSSSQSFVPQSEQINQIEQRSNKSSPRASLQNTTISKISVNILKEKDLIYNQINQSMIYTHFYLEQQSSRQMDNMPQILESVLKKLKKVYKTKKHIKNTFDEFIFRHFQEELGTGKRAEQKFKMFTQSLVHSLDPDPLTSIFINLISGQFSSLSSRVLIFFSSQLLAVDILSQKDIQDVDIVQYFISFLKIAFTENAIILKDDDLQLCLKHFLPKARDQLNQKFNRLRKQSSTKDEVRKRRPTLRPQSPNLTDLQKLEAVRIKIGEKKIIGEIEMTSIILNNCFSAIYAQDYQLRQLILIISSDVLQNSLSFEEIRFILCSIETNTNLIQSYMNKFSHIPKNKEYKKNENIRGDFRISFLDFHQIMRDNNLVKLIGETLSKPTKLIVSALDVFLPNQIAITTHYIQTKQELYYQWKDLQIILKTRLYMLGQLNGLQSRIINSLDAFLDVINNKSDNLWDHQFMNEQTLLQVFWLLVRYCNNNLVDSHVNQCLPEQLLDFCGQK